MKILLLKSDFIERRFGCACNHFSNSIPRFSNKISYGFLNLYLYKPDGDIKWGYGYYFCSINLFTLLIIPLSIYLLYLPH